MVRNFSVRLPFAVGILLLCSALAGADENADAEKQDEQLHAPLKLEEVRGRVLNWVAAREEKNPGKLEQVAALWQLDAATARPRDLFDSALGSFAIIDPSVRRLMAACHLQAPPLLAPEELMEKVVQNEAGDEFYLANVRMYYARYLVRRQMFDIALYEFDEIDMQQLIDPAEGLFHKAVCEHALLLRKDGLETLDALLNNTQSVPSRYKNVASLMQIDLERLKEQSLDEVARKMSDVERRLDLGRGGQKVRKIEDEIVATLDEIIKKIEQQQGGGGGGGGQGGNQSSAPAGDSSVKGQTAPGEVDKKKIGSKNGWGGLPPKKAAAARSQWERNFGPQYERIRKLYSKKLAGRRGENSP